MRKRKIIQIFAIPCGSASYSTWEPPSASESETDDLPSDESEDEYKDNNSTGMRRTPQ